MLWFLAAVALSLCFIHILFNYNERARLIRKVPGPKGNFVVGNAIDILTTPVALFQLMRDYSHKWNSINGFWSFPIAAVNVYHPDDVEIVISNTKHNTKSPLYAFLKSWLRDGLLLSKGLKWQSRRKLLTATFHFNILRQFCGILEDNSHRFVQNVSKLLGQSIDVIPLVTEYTLQSICETAMGSRLSEETQEVSRSYKESVYALGGQFVHRISRLYLHSDVIYNLLNFGKPKKDLETAHKFTEKVIKNRKEYIEKHGVDIFGSNNESIDENMYTKTKKVAMLDLLITAQKKGLIDDIGIQEEVDTFMFEGHDTTSSGITYSLMLIANHKDVQDKIVTELDDIFGDSERQANLDDLSKMKYLDRCIKESLRLYPPVPAIGRILSEDVTLSGYRIPKGTYCHIQIFDLHRRADVYKDPLVFDPDRFLPENSVDRHPFGYIPFSVGPRNCIGQKFAVMEMKSLLASILRRYELLPITKPEDLQFTLDLVLRTTHPVCVKFVKRSKN